MNWRQEVRTWLADNERSQAWLGRKAGLSEGFLSKCMTGVMDPGPLTRQALSKVTEIPLSVFHPAAEETPGGTPRRYQDA